MTESIANLLTLAGALALGSSAALADPPPVPANDSCAAATPAIIGGVVTGTCIGATPDGNSSCAGDTAPDVYHTLTTTRAGVYTLSLCSGAQWDSVLSVHRACPASGATEIICDDDGCRPAGSTDFGFHATLRVYLGAAATYLIRIAAFDSAATAGPYALAITGPAPMKGACCTTSGCAISTMSACMSGGGQYAGDLTACVLSTSPVQIFDDTLAPAPIPDHDYNGLSRTITIPPGPLTVGDIRVSVTLSHGCIGNLTMRLTHGSTTVTLIDRVGLGDLGSDATLVGKYTFSDTAPVTIWPYAPTPASGQPVPPGAYLCTDADANPISLRQAFAGTHAAGPWTLRIIDAIPGFTGELQSWSLRIEAAGASVCTSLSGACCIGTSCTLGTAAACLNMAGGPGAFHGAGTTCGTSPANPTTCCPANFNGAIGVDVGDIFAFLTAWFQREQPADFNANGVVSIQDLFAFLAAWFSGC